MSETAVQLEHVSKYYKLYDSPKDRLKEALHPFGKKRHREFYALKNIDLEVKKGEILGIVGRNGSGKSTLLQLIAKVIPANSGRITTNGKISTLLDLGVGLNPDLDGIQNIYFGGLMQGFPHEEMKSKLEEIVAFADIGEFIRQPLKTYSSGMKARLGFALAISIQPEILVVDEVLSVGDELFRRKCFAKMEEMFKSGCTVFFVSHSAANVIEICTKAILIDSGEIILAGTPKFVTINYEKFLFEEPAKLENFRKELIEFNQQIKKESVPVEFPKKPIESTASPQNNSSLFDNCEPIDIPKIFNDKSCIHEAVYLTEFQTKSKITHRTANIDLLDSHISTINGKKVNYLFPNEFYYLNHFIRFNEDAENIAVACVFKSEKGIILSGVRHPGVGKTLEKVIKNTTYLVKWKFKCAFLPGNYYLDLGVVGFKGGEKHVLAAEYDALVFKVQNCKCLKEKISSWAYFSIEPEIEMNEIQLK